MSSWVSTMEQVKVKKTCCLWTNSNSLPPPDLFSLFVFSFLCVSNRSFFYILTRRDVGSGVRSSGDKNLWSSLQFLFSWCYCGPNYRCPSGEAFVFLTIHAKFGNLPLQISQISPPFLHICNISVVGNSLRYFTVFIYLLQKVSQ